jgi:hypothetical protein
MPDIESAHGPGGGENALSVLSPVAILLSRFERAITVTTAAAAAVTEEDKAAAESRIVEAVVESVAAVETGTAVVTARTPTVWTQLEVEGCNLQLLSDCAPPAARIEGRVC